jgi:hypothetical protein
LVLSSIARYDPRPVMSEVEWQGAAELCNPYQDQILA